MPGERRCACDDLRCGDWEAALTTQQRARREASGVLAAHVQWHLERGLRSLPIVERDDGAEPQSPVELDLTWPADRFSLDDMIGT